ncbi:MAG TPA: M48 family metallopeptidase [Tepidisphaeraceae bacterium]|nr:M48 family metallopeptidase [Tepidisphaeraceae bacterium]
MTAGPVTSIKQCISPEEHAQRFGVFAINLLLWLLLLLIIAASMGIVLGLMILGWLVTLITAEYNVRKLQACGATVSSEQLPVVYQALCDVCQQFGLQPDRYRLIILGSGEGNAFAIKFARKRVIVILSELLEGIIDNPAELRAVIAHELAHSVLDHGWQSTLLLYRPAKYKQARELTCDNAALLAAGDLEAAKNTMKKLCVGNRLAGELSEDALIRESQCIEAGFVGWLIRQHLTHPTYGHRLFNLNESARRLNLSPQPPLLADAAMR